MPTHNQEYSNNAAAADGPLLGWVDLPQYPPRPKNADEAGAAQEQLLEGATTLAAAMWALAHGINPRAAREAAYDVLAQHTGPQVIPGIGLYQGCTLPVETGLLLYTDAREPADAGPEAGDGFQLTSIPFAIPEDIKDGWRPLAAATKCETAQDLLRWAVATLWGLRNDSAVRSVNDVATSHEVSALTSKIAAVAVAAILGSEPLNAEAYADLDGMVPLVLLSAGYPTGSTTAVTALGWPAPAEVTAALDAARGART